MVVAARLERARREPVPVFEVPAKRPANVIVTIAALNEARFIGAAVRDLQAYGLRCVVVDDGSTDGTGDAARIAGATVLRHPLSLGQGAALQTGIDWALANDADCVVTFDADGQHRAADVGALIEALSSGDADVALGSRFLGNAVNLPPSRRVMLRAAIWLTRLTTGLRITDTHNGLRAMTRRAAERIRLRQNGMAHASEILHQIAAGRLRWVEVPVTIQYNRETLAKGQSTLGFAAILSDLVMGRLGG